MHAHKSMEDKTELSLLTVKHWSPKRMLSGANAHSGTHLNKYSVSSNATSITKKWQNIIFLTFKSYRFCKFCVSVFTCGQISAQGLFSHVWAYIVCLRLLKIAHHPWRVFISLGISYYLLLQQDVSTCRGKVIDLVQCSPDLSFIACLSAVCSSFLSLSLSSIFCLFLSPENWPKNTSRYDKTRVWSTLKI